MQDVNVIWMCQAVFKSPQIVKYLNYFRQQIHQQDSITKSYVCVQ